MRTRLLGALALGVLLASAGVAAGDGAALERGKDGYFHTGDGIRAKSLVLLRLKIYAIGHDMREVPATPTKRAVMEMDVDKRLSWKMLRDAGGDGCKAFSARGSPAMASRMGGAQEPRFSAAS